jgi:nucleotide-binding universal stress UspA family protein
MSASVSHKLNSSVEGALAGGGDPATSPLYVFGPFLKLLVAAGVAQVTFGGAIWLAVLTIAVVSAMYRLVMRWVTDGSGGSGLSEDEFGSWAVKVNAAITFVEYTLTFLVSMAAMVTFIADRVPLLNESFYFLQYRTIVAIVLSLLTGWLVNRGPKVATLTFGPATAGVLLLLWAMVIATVVKTGFHLPSFDLQAFSPQYLRFTIGGYVRILAVMTGIEVFANLVAAYSGDAEQKSKKAFNSLLLIMGTTAVTMLIVGPAIFQFSDPMNEEVSVFTQTMDSLLPAPLPYFGTFIGIAVLMSASAASAQGLQNLALGLKVRHYIPRKFGERNQFDVADRPVWLEVSIVCVCFLLFGTSEETYLSLYAAGVFVLLSMTGWAVTKRLLREVKVEFQVFKVALLGGTIIAALLTTSATIIIFEERFLEGAWAYFVFIPILYAMFSYFRKTIGEPSVEMDYLGQLNAALLGGFGFGQARTTDPSPTESNGAHIEFAWQPEPIEKSHWRDQRVDLHRSAVLLDGSKFAAQALPLAQLVCENIGTRLFLLSSIKQSNYSPKQLASVQIAREDYLVQTTEEINRTGIHAVCSSRLGSPTETTKEFVEEKAIDMVITTTRGGSGMKHWLSEGLSSKLVHNLDIPVLLVQSTEDVDQDTPAHQKLDRILVTLDGSIHSEQALPYARALATAFGSELILLIVPAVPESRNYRAPSGAIEAIRRKTVENMKDFLEAVARSLREDGLTVRTVVSGFTPGRTIMEISEKENADMIIMTSQGRGGMDLFFMGSVAQTVVQKSDKPVFIVPIT